MTARRVATEPSARAPGAGVTIDRLTLRLPGSDATLGRRVAERASALLAARLPRGARGSLSELKLRVSARDLGEDGLGVAVAEALAHALERRGR